MNIQEYITKENYYGIPPIWFMRQAGRYLPEYRELRAKCKNFLDFCYNEELATEATLQPIRRFSLDAAIIFSDILVIPDSLGIKVSFIENEGPVIQTVRSVYELEKIKINEKILDPIYNAIKKVRSNLNKEISLIGFSGGIWTLMAYIIEGRGSKDLSTIKSIYYKDKNFILKLMDLLISSVSKHLIKQIEAGANIIQIFDSYAGFITTDDYEELIITPTNKIIENIKKQFPNVPIICFPRGSGYNYKEFCQKVNCDIISVDQYINLKWILENCGPKIIQGNLDPTILLTNDKNLLKARVDNIVNVMSNKKFIFNLGHGVLPTTPIENVEYLVNYIRMT